jgi:protein-ribulosamine 3-kinase
VPAVPPGARRWLAERYGDVEVLGAVGGGCINPAVRLRLPGGDAFLKFNEDAPVGIFAVEAEGLRALRAAAPSLRVPEVLGVWEPEDAAGTRCPAGLLLEWLEPGRPDAGFWERLGRGVAELHRAGSDGWGWGRDGFIGPLPQPNAPVASWAEFWWARRLEPQLRRARGAGWRVGRERDWDALADALPGLVAPAEEDGPSLLHGDLWSGNVLAAAASGRIDPALVDPAAYRGHREVDLAMAELFGGFDPAFFESYREAWPLQPGYRSGRRAAYQLFPLLVHVNLFGAGYLARTEQALQNALGAA